ncbi:MAG: SDR family NAD(P)-dependent oxidoreductase, partial [Archangium sp.]
MAGRNKKEASRLSLGALTAAGVGAVMGLRALLREKVSFEGRTVVLTGGSRGLGLVLARQFLGEGARVILCAREEVELARARDELKGAGGEVLAIPVH